MVVSDTQAEGELLYKASGKCVRDVARYFCLKLILAGFQDNHIRANVRRDLIMTNATDCKAGKLIPPCTIGH
jgi:hypothetical protein